MKKLILPAALLALGFASLNAPTRANWIPNMAEQVGQPNDYKVNADGSTSPFQAQASFNVAAPSSSYSYGSYPGSGSGQDAQVDEANQWKQTYRWDGSGTPYAFKVRASGKASGSCSVSETGFNNQSQIGSQVYCSLNSNDAAIPLGGYGYTQASGYGGSSRTGSYNSPWSGVDFVLSAGVDGNGNSTSFLTLSIGVHGSGSTYFGGFSGECTATGNLDTPILYIPIQYGH